MIPTLIVIYLLSAVILLYGLYQNVGKLEIHPPFSECIWHAAIVLTPVANTSVVLLLAVWKVHDWWERRKLR